MVRAGETITFQVVGTTAGIIPVDATDLRTQVVDRLGLYFLVTNAAITRGSLLSNILDFQWLHWDYRATVTIKTRLGYGDLDDVRSVIANAFYQAGGALPTVTAPGYGETQGPADTQTASGTLGSIGGFLTQTEYLLVGGAVAIVALIAFSPATRAAARGGIHVG